jgi:hypothetical protein
VQGRFQRNSGVTCRFQYVHMLRGMRNIQEICEKRVKSATPM